MRLLASLSCCCLVALAASACAVQAPEAPVRERSTPPQGNGASGTMPPAIQRVLDDIKRVDQEQQLAVSEEDGRFLRMLVAASGAKSILEIGGASGYSGIWLGLGARESGGRVVSIEYDPARAADASVNIQKAGLQDIVRNVHGDAFAEIPKLEGSFDFVFLDAWKPDYIKFFQMVGPRLSPGGVFLAHNVVNKKAEMEPFLSAVQHDPLFFTTIVSPSSEGMSVSYRIR